MEDSELIITEFDKRHVEGISGWISAAAMERVSEPNVHIVVAQDEDKLESVMVVECNEYMLNIIDIYTYEESRRNHIAGTLILEFIDYYNELTDYSLKYVKAEFNESNYVAEAFYGALGFDIEKDESAEKIIYTLKAVNDSIVLNKNHSMQSGYTLLSYKELDNVRRKLMYQQIKQAGGILVNSLGKFADEEFSYSIWDGDKLISVAEIIIEEDEIILGQIFIVRNSISSVLYMLKTMAGLLLKKFSVDTNFSIYLVKPSAKRLLTSALGDDYRSECLMRAVLNLEEFEDKNGGESV